VNRIDLRVVCTFLLSYDNDVTELAILILQLSIQWRNNNLVICHFRRLIGGPIGEALKQSALIC